MSAKASSARTPRTRDPSARTSEQRWFRFWVRMVVAALVFNLVAGLVTWFLIFPRLFPTHG